MDRALAVEVAALSKRRALDETIAHGGSDIQGFYRNSTVFITGGSGFMGKQLIEKLFRACQLSKVFMLLRPKKGKAIQERMEEIVADSVFDVLRKQQPDFMQKLVPIPGDTAELRLAISDQNWETIVNETDVIFHVAATTRFDESLLTATLINVRGAREVVSLARACKHLRSLVHVSTAYTQSRVSLFEQKVYERFYPVPIPADTLLAMSEALDVDIFNGLATSLIKDWPNTYCFTKAVAEDLVRTSTAGLPVCIVRPGIVISTYREPVPAWLDSSCVYSASGVILGTGLGVFHVLHKDNDKLFGLVPCDYVNNAIIAAAKEAVNCSGGEDTQIYTVTTVARKPLQHGEFTDILFKHRDASYTPKAIYYAYLVGVANIFIFNILSFLWHTVPAYLVDFLCLLLGKERRFVKLVNRINKLSASISFFCIHNWIFVDANLEKLYSNLSKQDKTIFNFDISSIDWDEFIPIWGIGVRKYLVKDGLQGTENAGRKQYWLRIVNYCVLVIYAYVLWKLFAFVLFSVRSVLCCQF